MQASLNKTGRGLAKLAGLAIVAFPMLLAGCPNDSGGALTITLTGCPSPEIGQGASFMLTATVTNSDDMDVTANSTFTFTVTSGTTTLTVVPNSNVGTVTVPAAAALGAYVIDVDAELTDDSGMTGNVECRFNIVEGADCATNADCDDDDACNGAETCSNGTCVDGTALDCDDDVSCTTDTCVPATGCVNTDNCPAGQVCNEDLDPPACTECAVAADCNDSDGCTVDVCSATGVCDNTGVTDCDDSLDCTMDSCTPATGCANVSNCAAATPVCTATGCVECATTADCQTGEVCTANVCVPEGGTDCSADPSICDDGQFCNGNETCGPDMLCVAGTLPCNADTQTCNEESNTCTDIPGQTFNLTTEVDILVGTGLADLFRGVVQATGSTLNPGDSLDGGASIDAFNITQVDANYNPVATIQRIENFFVFNADSGTARIFNTAGINESQQLWTDRSLGSLEFTNVNHIVGVGVKETDQDVTVTFLNNVLTGTDDTVAVILMNTGSSSSEGVDVVIRSDGADGAETIEVTTCGQPEVLNSIGDDGENDFDTLVINNPDPVEIRAVDSSVDTIDGSGGTASQDVELPGEDVAVTGGSGDDIFRATATSSDTSIDGGPGMDTLVSEGGVEGTLSNVEVAQVDHTDGTLTLDLENAPDLAQVDVNNTANNFDTLDATNLPDPFALNIDSDVSISINNASNFSLNPDVEEGSSNMLSLAVTGNANNFTLNDTLDTGELEHLNLNLNVDAVTINTNDAFDGGGDDTLESVTGMGAANLTINGNLADTDTLTEADFGAMTGNVILNNTLNDGAADIDITTGPGNDTLLGGTGNDTLTSGDGNDDLIGDDGNDIMDGGEGNDFLEGDAGEDNLDGGAGNDDLEGGDDNDSIDGGNGNDDIEGGEGEDELDPGSGIDTLIFGADHADTDDADTTVFEPGSGGDILQVEVAGACGGLAPTLANNFASGNTAVGADNTFIVITSEAFDTYTDVEAQVDTDSGTIVSFCLCFLVDGDAAQCWLDDDSSTPGGCLLATMENISTLSDLSNLIDDNFDAN